MPSPATIAAAAVLAAVVILVVRYLWKNRKAGCSSCGSYGGCGGACHGGDSHPEEGGCHCHKS